jgi:hypothetical protein
MVEGRDQADPCARSALRQKWPSQDGRTSRLFERRADSLGERATRVLVSTYYHFILTACVISELIAVNYWGYTFFSNDVGRRDRK